VYAHGEAKAGLGLRLIKDETASPAIEGPEALGGIGWPFGGWLAGLALHQTIKYPSMYQPGNNQYKPLDHVRMHPTIRYDGRRKGRAGAANV
jgi:hypothetical protein